MEILPVSFTFQIQLSKIESDVFRVKLPGSRDIEAFVEQVVEEGATITVNTEDDSGIVFMTVEADADYHPLYGEAKREAARIQRAFEKLVKGE
jgi:hypothetical protein